MNKIEEGKQMVRPVSRSSVRSKVFSNLSSSSPVPPAGGKIPDSRHPLRDLSRCGSANSDNNQSRRQSPSRSNSNISNVSTKSQAQQIKQTGGKLNQRGISKQNGSSAGKQLKESKSVTGNNNNVNNSTRTNNITNNRNAVNSSRKTSANENKPQTKTNKKSLDEKVPVTSRKESVRKTSKDVPTSTVQKSKTSTKKVSTTSAPAPVPASSPSVASPSPSSSPATTRASTTCQQPDLVKFTVSGAHVAQHNEIDRLETLLETRVSHVSRLEERHKENMVGCHVMSILLANMSQKVCSNEKLQRRIDQLSNSVDEANLQISLKDEAFKVLQLSLEEKTEEFQELIASLKQEQVNSLESVSKKHEIEIEKLKKDAQLEIHEMETKHQEEVSELLNKHNQEKSRLEHLHTSSFESFKTKMSEHEDKLQSVHDEEKSILSSKITDLSAQVKSLEESLCNGSDYRLKMAQGKMMNLQQEVDSLKTVLEMRTGEVHELRTDKVKLEEKLELYDQQQLALRKMP